MLSASMFWRSGRLAGHFAVRDSWERPAEHIFLDSAGFSTFVRHGDYPWSVEQYADLVTRIAPDYVATMDYACEPGIDSSVLPDVEARQLATIAHTEALRDADMPGTLVPVLQGWEPEQYVAHIDMYRDAGISLDGTVAIGSLCGRNDLRDITDILSVVRAILPGSRLHAFGLKITALRTGIAELIDSCDTAAWLAPRSKRTELWWPPTADDERGRFERYRRRVDATLAQRTLFEIACATEERHEHAPGFGRQGHSG
jgi:hypothetical protein